MISFVNSTTGSFNNTTRLSVNSKIHSGIIHRTIEAQVIELVFQWIFCRGEGVLAAIVNAKLTEPPGNKINEESWSFYCLNVSLKLVNLYERWMPHKSTSSYIKLIKFLHFLLWTGKASKLSWIPIITKTIFYVSMRITAMLYQLIFCHLAIMLQLNDTFSKLYGVGLSTMNYLNCSK